MEREREYGQELEDMAQALQSAIAHSGTGPQKCRWEMMLGHLREEQAEHHRRLARRNLQSRMLEEKP